MMKSAYIERFIEYHVTVMYFIHLIFLGVEGGFNPDEKQFEFEETISIVILPKWKVIPYPSPELPDIAKISAEAIMGAEDPLKAAEAAAMANTWEGEERKVSK